MEPIQILKGTISNILQKMFFLIEESPLDEFIEKYEFHTFVKNKDLEIHLLFTKDFAEEITRNFLGINEDVDDDIEDCIKEITNMICGNFVGECFPELEKSLPLPESKRINHEFHFNRKFSIERLFYNSQPMKFAFAKLF
ncbi:MAG: chemotaxis protein CheX [Candidatus Cloacimonetes bacterium]|nr:chemotaxis protein CheX [Candidatus Cloacimonadota bacterium]